MRSTLAHFFYKNLPISLRLIKQSPNQKIYLSKGIFVHSAACGILHELSQRHPNVSVRVADYNLPGGIQHRLLSGEGDSITIENEKNMVEGSLRLVKPLPISFLGGIELENSILIGYGANGYKSVINWKQPDYCYQDDERCVYNKEDLEVVRYLTGFLSNKISFSGRVKKITCYFMHKDIWENLYCRDTIFQGLFAALDALALNPPRRHGKIISSNIGKWLNYLYPMAIERGIDFEQLILRLWESYRHNYMHCSISSREPSIHYKLLESGEYGYVDSDKKVTEVSGEIIQALMSLHEIVRLLLLSILFLPEENRKDFLNFPLIENHKYSTKAEKTNRCNLIEFFFSSLITEKIKPCKLFWMPNIHDDMFLHFLNPSVLQL